MPDEASGGFLLEWLASGALPSTREPSWDASAIRGLLAAIPNDRMDCLIRTLANYADADGTFKPRLQAVVTLFGNARAAQTLETELAKAEADLRIRMPEIASKLPEVEKAAEEIAADPEKTSTVERISRAVRTSDVSKLSPLALLVILWWLFVVSFPKDATNDVAVLALWYAVARDSWTKKGD